MNDQRSLGRADRQKINDDELKFHVLHGQLRREFLSDSLLDHHSNTSYNPGNHNIEFYKLRLLVSVSRLNLALLGIKDFYH